MSCVQPLHRAILSSSTAFRAAQSAQQLQIARVVGADEAVAHEEVDEDDANVGLEARLVGGEELAHLTTCTPRLPAAPSHVQSKQSFLPA